MATQHIWHGRTRLAEASPRRCPRPRAVRRLPFGEPAGATPAPARGRRWIRTRGASPTRDDMCPVSCRPARLEYGTFGGHSVHCVPHDRRLSPDHHGCRCSLIHPVPARRGTSRGALCRVSYAPGEPRARTVHVDRRRESRTEAGTHHVGDHVRVMSPQPARRRAHQRRQWHLRSLPHSELLHARGSIRSRARCALRVTGRPRDGFVRVLPSTASRRHAGHAARLQRPLPRV